MTLKTNTRRAATFPAAAGAAIVLSFATICPVQAQTVPPTGGAILQQLLPVPTLPVPPGDVIRLPEPAQQRSRSTLPIPVKELTIEGATLIPLGTLKALVRDIEGQTPTLGELQAAAERITEAYQKQGYPLAFAYLPAQKIHDGIVRIAVVEPGYDRIKTKGKTRLREETVVSTVGVRAGEMVTQASLERGLLLLNRTPGVQANGILLPGANPGTSTLQIGITDQPVFSGNLTENNYGNRYTGTMLSNGSMSVANPFGYGSELSVNGTESDTGGLSAGGFDLTSPNVWNGLRFGVYGSSSFYKLGGSFASLNELGRTVQLGGDASIPLILRPGTEVNLRFDVYQQNLAQSTKSTQTLATQSMLIERLRLEGVWSDSRAGVNSAAIGLFHGDLSVNSGALAANLAGPATVGSFEYVQSQLGRVQQLPSGFSLSIDATGQLSNKNLDSSQWLYLGGPTGVMSYGTGEGGGAEGYLLHANLSHAVPLGPLPGELKAALQAQNGTIWTLHTGYAGATGPERLTLSGVGVQLTYKWKDFELTAAYTRRLGAASGVNYETALDRFWIQAGISF